MPDTLEHTSSTSPKTESPKEKAHTQQTSQSTTNIPTAQAPTIVIDTCVLLSDPTALYAFNDAHVVLPLVVIEELDGKKQRQDEVGAAARAVINDIEKLRLAANGDLSTSAPLPTGGDLRIETNGLHLDRLKEFHLDTTKADNKILAAALGLMQKDDVGEVIVSTLDVALRIKAAQIGLTANDYVRPTSRPTTPGRTTYETTADVVSALHKQRSLRIEDIEPNCDNVACVHEEYEQPHFLRDLPNNTFLKINATSPNSTVLARKHSDCIKAIEHDKGPWGLSPRGMEQKFALDLLLDETLPIVALAGHAGTGKTILSIAAALEQVFEPESQIYDRLMILRPVVAVGRQELGFLPGDLAEKLGPWFEAIVDTMVALGENITYKEARDRLDIWVNAGTLTLEAPTFLRGRSLQSTFVIVDEAQNLEPLVAKTILTRLGEGSKAVLLGDVSQIDSPWLSKRTNALTATIEGLSGSPLFGHLLLQKGQRSPAAEAAARLL